MSEALAPTEGPLTVDAAVQSLLTPQTEQAPEAPAEAAEEPVQTEGADQTPDDTPEPAAEPTEGEETEAEAEPVVAAEPPKYWSKDAKEAFSQLSPELQAVVLAQEGPREEAAAKAKAEAAAIRQQADAEMGKVSQLAAELADFLPRAVQKFSQQWGSDPDWAAYAKKHGAEAMVIAKAEHDADLADLQRLAVANENAQAEAQQTYVRTEFAKLAEIAPHLTDPKEGLAKRQGIVSYLKAQGVDPTGIEQISAVEMVLAEKAMRLDAIEAAAKVAPKPKPAAPAQRVAPVRPAASSGAQPSPIKQAEGRFYQSRSVDDAVALLLAKRR